MNIGLLTSGGDCAGLNTVMYGFAKALAGINPKAEIYGIANGYTGLIDKDYRKLKPQELFTIHGMGGTILGTSRQPYKKLIAPEGAEKIALMKENYRKMGLDVLVVLGVQGAHKTAALLSGEGLKIIGIPKTIDNDLLGTDVTFGFHSAVRVATESIDKLHTTTASHGRVMLVEIMGNRVGWLTLYSGVGGNADILLIPEIPFDMDSVVKAADAAVKRDKYCIIAVSEGALDKEEAAMPKKERYQKREERGEKTVTNRVAKAIETGLNIETRTTVLGYIQRGGSPSPYDRIICIKMGTYAAKLVTERVFGVSVAICGGRINHNNIADTVASTKHIPLNHELVVAAKNIGISFGE